MFFFLNGDVVISPMPQPPTLKDHGISLLSASFIEISLAWMILPTLGLLQAQVLSSLLQASLSPGKNMHSKRQGY